MKSRAGRAQPFIRGFASQSASRVQSDLISPRRFWRSLLAGAVGLALGPAGEAWSSLSFPPFREVHQMAIANVLAAPAGPVADAHLIEILQDQQTEVDHDQDARHSFEHAMTGVEDGHGENVERANYIKWTNEFIHDRLVEAIDHRHKNEVDQAYESLGKAIHPLQDATSPVHEKFQPWYDDEGLLDFARHGFQERVYPEDSRRDRLEGVVRYAYAIFMEAIGPVPTQYFDGKGDLLPQTYHTPLPAKK